MKNCLAALFAVLLLACSGWALAAPTDASRELPPGLQVPDAALPGPGFDADRATEAYLALLSPEQRATSDAYFEGGYWLGLWGFLYGLGVAVLLLASGLSQRMRALAERLTRRPWLATWLYAVQWLVVATLASLPFDLYAGWWREQQYALGTQTLPAWLGDQAKGLAVGLIIAPLLVVGAYALIRRFGERWWSRTGIAAFVVILFISMIAPVYISPLFNDYKPLPDGPARDAVLSLAHANRVPTDHVEWFDASRQTTRISANVSGFAGTTRVNLNDNLLERTSLPEIKAVMGHEMGHYVLNHGLRLTVYFALLITFGLWFVHVGFDRLQARWGRRFGIRDRTDPVGLPLALALFSTFFFVASPVSNSIVRQAEAEADAYGLNAAREPHGFAMAAVRLATYRKLAPGPWEEVLFYDHPSGWDRVHRSMEWLAQNPDNPTAVAAREARRPAAPVEAVPVALPTAADGAGQ